MHLPISKSGNALVTSRGERYYRNTFEHLDDGLILDLGPGLKRELPHNRIGVDRYYADENPANQGNNVAANFEELPFADESFDHTIASLSLGYSDASASLEEALRVTKAGGMIQIANANVNPFNIFNRNRNKEYEALARLKYTRSGVNFLAPLAIFSTFTFYNTVTSIQENGINDSKLDIFLTGCITTTSLLATFLRSRKLVIERSDQFADADRRAEFTSYIMKRFLVF